MTRLRPWLDPEGRPLPSRWEQLGGARWQPRVRDGGPPAVRAQLPAAGVVTTAPVLLTLGRDWEES
ncbi:hypothetical protein GCM10010289_83930 [Streptomyces violascens]|uniref:Uncharacterized protein n=1 Tax=Streptomyces violascens TaxID=67381 RepID=A0ABQ3QSE4_9ACTN|nr:hypothetical protein GCM10010289_83930 [Streptomyces violascens]GHI40172.1 hypothetical protein Sviol_45800 [Streptomyces violascens]